MLAVFSPASFHTLAVELKKKATGDCAELRSAISRAYYAALICARDAKQLTTTGSEGHVKLIAHYRASRDPSDRAVANSLELLKTLRAKADYQPTTLCTGSNGSDAIREASKVLQILKVLPIPAVVPATKTMQTAAQHL